MTLIPPSGGFGDVLFPSANDVVLGLPLMFTHTFVQGWRRQIREKDSAVSFRGVRSATAMAPLDRTRVVVGVKMYDDIALGFTYPCD